MTTGKGRARRGLLLLLTIVVIARDVARRPHTLIAKGSAYVPARGPSRPRQYMTRWLVALFLASAVIIQTDLLGSVANDEVTALNKHWWGAAQESPWLNAADHGITFLTRNLTITINGDQLTAKYEATALADSLVASTAESDTDTEAGDDLVDNVLGQMLVGEFHYGITGNQIQATSLTFNTPQVEIATDKNKRLIATLDVESDPFRLDEHRQQVTILPPAASVAGGPMTAIQLNAPAVQVTRPAGVKVDGIANGTANLQVNLTTVQQSDNASFAVTEGNTSPSWFDGLRAVGGITLPIMDAFLFRLLSIFCCAIFLWAFYRARRKFPDNQLINAGLKAVETVVAALAAVAVLGFAYDLSTKFWGSADRSYLAAGPMGLLVGGAAVLWPVACWRAGALDSGHLRRARGPARPAKKHLRWRAALIPILVHLAIAGLYLFRLHRLGVSPLTPMVIAGTTSMLVAVPLLVRALFVRGPLAWVASAGLLGAALAAACSWPLLYTATNWFSANAQSAHINLWGKWTYVTVALIAAAGLCVMWGRIALTAVRHDRPRSRPARTLVVMAVVAIILAAIVPDVVSESSVASPHAVGLVPLDLFGLFDAVPQLLIWLLLVLAIVVTMRLPPTPDPRAVARDMALPIAVMLLYEVDTWLYLPISMIVGIFLIRRLMMPRRLAEETPLAGNPEACADDAAADWRRADFVAGQQQALAESSTDALRESLLNVKDGEFQRRLTRLAKAQDDLTAKRDALQRAARSAKIRAFSRRGAAPDLGSAAVGTLTGTILGIIPAAVTMLTTQPPSDGGSYPVLSFFGNTAWNLFAYAGLGWFVGYFLPLIRGDSGAGKALWVFTAGAAASLPDGLIWNDAQGWTVTMVYDLELLVFLLVLTVIVCDLRTLQRARLRPTDWIRVHNWRFVASWSAALVAAIGTIVITFATTTVTDLSQQLTRQPPSTSNATGSSSTGSSATSSGSTGGGQ
ncbi:MAG TPA: hypothetical protein VHT26_12850 [Trebonia sp.]|nr:hypothetical protein [Trebonia sp.]